MSRIVLCAVLISAMGGLALADDPPAAPAPAPEASTAGLIEAAKQAKERRKKTRAKVITNADVRKSKGRIAENKPGEITVVAQAKSITEEHAESLAATKAAEARVAAAESRVAELERTVASIESSYYDESDLDRRDTTVVARFNEARQLLDVARRELEEARAALPRSEPPAADGADPSTPPRP